MATEGEPLLQKQTNRRSRRRLWPSLLVVFGVAVAGSFVRRFIATPAIVSPQTSLAEAPVTAVVLGDERDGETLAPVHVTTEECTGDTSKPVARGADVVAYRSLRAGQPAVFGSRSLSAAYGRYLFFFSSLENKQEFERNPGKYVPAFGGFCSWGVSHEMIWTAEDLGPPADPNFWLIYDDQLFLFRSATPFGKFHDQIERNIAHGNTVWGEWFGELAEWPMTPFNTACFCSVDTCTDG